MRRSATPHVQPLHRLTTLLRETLGVRYAAILLDDDEGAGRLLRDWAVSAGGVVAVEDARRVPALAEDPAVRVLHLVAGAGAPVGHGGAVVVFSDDARSWGADDLVRLRGLAASVAAELARAGTRRLAVVRPAADT